MMGNLSIIKNFVNASNKKRLKFYFVNLQNQNCYLSKKNLLIYLKIILMIYKINQENSSLVRKF